ncbi:protein SHQ1 homolog [Polistes fuscatus]|uniref:protein SHQ1 homolog n=1 Tax=Polistes fuscatus TaxID=30207 RepID=UPI001CA9179A|nr:protein SHQ1 homolog [Polistes fuscatus]
MLTPAFSLTQTDDEVTIIIHSPYADIKDTQIEVDGNDFRFYAIPYYLRLTLPGEIEETSTSSGSYDCDKGCFTLKFSKVNKGEFFPNLDMITTLLSQPKPKHSIGPKIEVIGNPAYLDQINTDLEEGNKEKNDNEEDDKEEDDKEDDKEENDKEASNKWFIPQSIEPNNSSCLLINAPKYGFANKISGALKSFEPPWIKEVIDLPSPDNTPEEARKYLREAMESKNFRDDHYMADFVETEYAGEYILYTPPWYNLKKEDIKFDTSEIEILKELPNKEYLLDNEEIHRVLLSLIDILYGSCYNHRTTHGDNTVESGWTINKLSSTLCWFQTFNSMGEVIKACIRRSLCYPLIRNWKLSIEVFEDVKQIVKLGKKYIIKQFCEIHTLFNNSHEPRYLLNQLYIKDYLIWLQQIPESLMDSLIPLLNNVHPSKENMNLDLVELEAAINCTLKENIVIENIIDDITKHAQNLTLNVPSKNKEESSSDDDDDDDTSTSIDSSDTDTDSENDSFSSSSSSSTSVDSDESEIE